MRFSKFRAHFIIFSILLGVFLYGVTFLKHGGFAKSISFNGGIRLTVQMPSGVGTKEIEDSLKKIEITDAQVRLSNVAANQYDLEFGPKVRERIETILKENEKKQEEELKKTGKTAPHETGSKSVAEELERMLLPVLGVTKDNVISRESISPSFASDLFRISTWGFLLTIALIGIYLYFRFTFPFAVGASLSLIHDVVLTLGFIGTTQIEPSTPVLAAVLTLIGYSINDTIVIFDRIRSNVQDHEQFSLPATMDLAMTQTLSRTVVTSLLTLLSVFALLFGGAVSLRDFSLVLIFGIVIGTYSSIFIAAHYVQYYDEFKTWWRSRK